MGRATVITAIALLGSPAAAAGQVVTVVNDAHVSRAVIASLENAVVREAEVLRRHWHTPTVSFGRNGWTVRIVTRLPSSLEGLVGGHSVNAQGEPYAEVGPSGWDGGVPVDRWAPGFSHEIMEMLVDPYLSRYVHGRLAEVCDPVSDDVYLLNGVSLADFVYPRWFWGWRRGPWDVAGDLTGPGRAARSQRR